MQTAKHKLNSVAIELATTDSGTTGINTCDRMTASVQRLVKATFSSLEQEQDKVRTTRYTSEEPSKRRRLYGKVINLSDAYEDAEAAAVVREAASSGGDSSDRELPPVKNIV